LQKGIILMFFWAGLCCSWKFSCFPFIFHSHIEKFSVSKKNIRMKKESVGQFSVVFYTVQM
jgi:hypothetical protein